VTTLPANPTYYGITWLAGSVIIVHSGNRRVSVHTSRVQEKVRSDSVGASQDESMLRLNIAVRLP
jgi:hypothetical protein